MTRPSISLPLLLSLLALLIALATGAGRVAAANADERWYQIELIVFENKVSDDATETWTEDVGKPDPKNVIELRQPMAPPSDMPSPADNAVETPDPLLPAPAIVSAAPQSATGEGKNEPQPPQPFTLLPEEQLTLNDIIASLNKASNYHPLLHIGWQQMVPERGDAHPILIDSRKLLLYTARIADEPPAPTSSGDTNLDDAGFNSSALPPPPTLYGQVPDEVVTTINENFVNGTLTLARGRYLHMGLDLVYEHQPNSPQLFSFFGFGNAGDVPEEYRLTQRRRLKRGELNYFDHPKFGVLALVTAVEEDPNAPPTGGAQTIPLRSLR